MFNRHILFFTVVILSFCFLPQANGQPRYIHVAVTPNGQDLHASVSGTFMFPGPIFNIPGNFTMFPVPPDADNIEIEELDLVPWIWSGAVYQTLFLPQQSFWPMIQWELPYFSGPYFPFTITYYIQYEHELVKRDNKYVFFYADESFELIAYGPIDYPHGLFSATWSDPLECTIDFPQTYSIVGVWSRDIPLDYQVNGNQLTFSADCQHADRITVEIKPPCAYSLAGDLNGNCKVNVEDLVILVDQWLQSPGKPSADIAPVPDGDSFVNSLDFAIMAENWLIDCYENPSNPACVPK